MEKKKKKDRFPDTGHSFKLLTGLFIFFRHTGIHMNLQKHAQDKYMLKSYKI